MFLHRQHYFNRLTKSYPLLKLIDVYDKEVCNLLNCSCPVKNIVKYLFFLWCYVNWNDRVNGFSLQSFIREYVLDNIFVCIFMYILFYFAIWYAHKVRHFFPRIAVTYELSLLLIFVLICSRVLLGYQTDRKEKSWNVGDSSKEQIGEFSNVTLEKAIELVRKQHVINHNLSI